MAELRKYGVGATFIFPLFAAGTNDFKVDASHASGDSVISKDEGAQSNTTNGFVDEGSFYSLTLTSTEMEAARIAVVIIDQGTKAYDDQMLVIETYGHSSAQHEFDLDAASTPQTGDNYARLGAPAGASVSADVAAVKTQTAAIEVDTQDLQTQVGTDGAGLTALPWNAAWDTEVQSEVTDALNAYDPPTKAELDSAVSPLATAANLATVAGYLDTEIAAILADTNELQTDWANGGRLDLILDARASQTSVDTIDGIVDSILVDTAEIGAAGAGLTALASATNLATVDTVVDAIKAVTDKVDDTLEDDAGTFRFTANALEEAPTGGSAPSAADIRAEIDANSTKLADILTDTGTTIPGTIATLQTSVDAIPTNAELATALTPIALEATLTTIDGLADAIKAKTDSLTFTVAGQVDANIQYVNDVAVTGDGQSGTEWGPA